MYTEINCSKCKLVSRVDLINSFSVYGKKIRLFSIKILNHIIDNMIMIPLCSMHMYVIKWMIRTFKNMWFYWSFNHKNKIISNLIELIRLLILFIAIVSMQPSVVFLKCLPFCVFCDTSKVPMWQAPNYVINCKECVKY